MIDWSATRRRISIAALALTVSAVILHGEISTMLVNRGDALMYAGSEHVADLYARALLVDSRNTVAADRLMYLAIVSHDAARLRAAIALSTRVMSQAGQNDMLIMDRALCEQLLRDYRAASRDFQYVAFDTRDPRAALFTADDDLRLGLRREAVVELHAALRDDRGFVPALKALRRLETER